MKILITTDLYEPKINGVVTSVLNLKNELEKRNHEVKILTVSDKFHSYKKDNVYYMKSVGIGKIYPDIRMPVVYSNKFMKEIVEWKPDVIHSQCEFFSFTFAKHVAVRTKAPIVHTYHTLYEQYADYVIKNSKFSNKAIAFASKARLKKVETIIAPTDKVRNALKNYGVANKVVVIPTGIDIAENTEYTGGLSRDEICEKYGIPKDDRLLLSLGRLGHEKNIKELIDFFAVGLKQNPSMTFLIVGGGPAKEDLVEYAKETGVSHKVRFTGMVPHDITPAFYKAADVFMCASTSETQGLTYIEAVSNGIPLLCRKDRCIEDVVLQGKNGFQYETEEDFMDYLGQILANEDIKLGAEKCKEEIMKRFGKEKFVDDVEAEYEKCQGKTF